MLRFLPAEGGVAVADTGDQTYSVGYGCEVPKEYESLREAIAIARDNIVIQRYSVN